MKENLLMLVFKSNKNWFKDQLVNFFNSIRKNPPMPVQPAIESESVPVKTSQHLKLTEIGKILQRYRQSQGMTLETVYEMTMIRESVLENIEKGKIDQLPEPIYLQSMIKRYADTLGLNGAELAQEFFQETDEIPMIGVPKTQLQKPRFQLKPAHLYIVYILLILGSVHTLTAWMNRSQQLAEQVDTPPTTTATTPPAPSPSPAPAKSPAPAPSPVASVPPSPQPVPVVSTVQNPPIAAPAAPRQPTTVPSPGPSPASPTQAQTPSRDTVEVGLTLKDASWVLVEVDGKTEFEGILPQGTQKTWQAKEQLVIVAGNAGGVFVTVNNGQAQQFGEPGTVKEVTFTADAEPSAPDTETATQDQG